MHDNLIISLLYQTWIALTLSAAIAAVLLGIITFQQQDESINRFKRAVGIAYFGIAIEIASRFIALILHVTPIPLTELILCSIGRLIECAGLWGLVFYLLSIWPFNKK